MTKQLVEEKIKEIILKYKRFIGATIEIKFKDKNKNEEIITASIWSYIPILKRINF